MQARLKVVQDNANLKQVKLLPITVIGRGAECHLKIASTEVSRKHCRITVTENDVRIEDLNSSNGTYVDKVRIPAGETLVVVPGATLHIGPAVFIVDYTPPLTLESMPTTVLKSSESPFLKELTAAAPLAITAHENGTAGRTPGFPAAGNPFFPPNNPPALDPSSEATVRMVAGDISTVRIALPVPPPVVDVPPALPVPPPVVSEEKTVPASQTPLAKPVSPPRAIPVRAAPVVSGQTAPTPAAPVVVPPVADVAVASPLPSSPAPTPPAPAFDFLGSSTESPVAASPFDFAAAPSTPAASTPPPAVPVAAPAPKKSLFGLFGKKEKPPATSVPPAPVVPPEAEFASPTAAAAEPGNPFAFFGEPAPAEPQPIVSAAVVPVPAPVPAPVPFASPDPIPDVPPPSEPSAPSDDPFAFLR